MPTILNQHQLGSVPNNTIQNPKNDSYYLSIKTCSVKDTTDQNMVVTYNMRNGTNKTNDEDKYKVKSQ